MVGDNLKALEAFNPKATCPKCGWEDVSTHYCNKIRYGSVCYTILGYTDDEGSEHFHRTCDRCRYAWIERCIES